MVLKHTQISRLRKRRLYLFPLVIFTCKKKRPPLHSVPNVIIAESALACARQTQQYITVKSCEFHQSVMHPIQRDIILDASNVYHTIRNLLDLPLFWTLCSLHRRLVFSNWGPILDCGCCTKAYTTKHSITYGIGLLSYTVLESLSSVGQAPTRVFHFSSCHGFFSTGLSCWLRYKIQSLRPLDVESLLFNRIERSENEAIRSW